MSSKVAVTLAVPTPAVRLETGAEVCASETLRVLPCSLRRFAGNSIGGNSPQPAKSVLAPNASIDPNTSFFIYTLLHDPRKRHLSNDFFSGASRV